MISAIYNKVWRRFNIIFRVKCPLRHLYHGEKFFIIVLTIKDLRKNDHACYRREDYEQAQKLPKQEQGALYNDLKAAAESGWDFSYRWCVRTNNNTNLSLLNVSTSNIIPVDLNAIIQRNAKLLARFHGILGNAEVSLCFSI